MNTNYSIIFSTEISVDNNKLKYYERIASENAFNFHNHFISKRQPHLFASSPIDKHVIIIKIPHTIYKCKKNIVNNNKLDFINDYILTFLKTIGKAGHESKPCK